MKVRELREKLLEELGKLCDDHEAVVKCHDETGNCFISGTVSDILPKIINGEWVVHIKLEMEDSSDSYCGETLDERIADAKGRAGGSNTGSGDEDKSLGDRDKHEPFCSVKDMGKQ